MASKIYESLEAIKNELNGLNSLAKKNWPDDKWALLHNHALKAFELEVQRFHRLDDKSTKFITAISVVITAFSALVNWVSGNEDVNFTPYIYVLLASVFVSLALSWVMFFLCLKMTTTSVLDIEDTMLEDFKSKNIATIRVGIFKGLQKSVKERRVSSDKKAKFLNWGYNCTAVSGLCMVLLVIAMSGETLYQNHSVKQSTEVSDMSDPKDNAPQENNDEPDFDVKPMGVGVALENDSSPLVPPSSDDD
ncbi:hypothetical protein BBM16_15180 [Vibrio parahaemolyticus]|uniref:hypothetical protein n=1 Tax=Vibrio parahaemolyticus TaxID=670 RepID=UPI00084B316A|nr:hypothetical protein [Vibrio parahaemolyticus]ODY14419.1 hypothetical protein BBM16_15180 [Vibrio parahaemolyticus]